MTDTSILIIGAGIAGLSAGCYGQMNGYETQIFELHSLPGGLCTSWKRKGYTFDGCVHWLLGTKPGTGFHGIWEELGAVQGRPIVNHEEYIRIEGAGGKTFIAYTDLGRLEAHMKELSPQDADVIDEYIGAMRRMAKGQPFSDKSRELMGPLDMLKMLPMLLSFMPTMRHFGDMAVHAFAQRVRDPFLRSALIMLNDPPDYRSPEMPMALAVMLPLPAMDNGDAGYPVGGSLELARAIERRYLGLGGQIHYKARVEKILVENGKAVGVRLADGSEERGDIVISAADGHATIFDMLEGRYVDDEILGYYRDLAIFHPIVQVSLGVARDFSDEPHAVYFPLDTPVQLAGQKREVLGLKHYCFDPTMAPKGKSVLVCWLDSSYDYWKELSAERARYEAEKAAIADAIIGILEQRFQGLRQDVEVVDVATPLTYHRYTNNWQGSPEGWAFSPKTMRMAFGNGMRKTLPGLGQFYMIGQWVEPGGGLPASALAGRNVIQVLCHKDKRRFVASVPAA